MIPWYHNCFECWFRFQILCTMFGWQPEQSQEPREFGSCPFDYKLRQQLGLPVSELPTE